MKKNIIKLDLIGSSSCNLNCSYCYIAKNNTFFNYDYQIKNAWETGEYLNTIQKVFEKFNCDTKNVKDLEFWGGEPTIHLKEIAKHGEKLGKLFPNLEFVLIPTNFYQINMNALLDFIYNLSKGVKSRNDTSKNIGFHLQLSIDGPPGDFNTYGHNVKWEQYKKQFDEFCECLSYREELKNISIIFAISATSQQQYILKNLNTFEKISEFKNFINNAITYANNRIKQIKNAEVMLSSTIWTPTIAIPQTTSIEEALEIEKIIKLLEYHDYIYPSEKIELKINETQCFHNCITEKTYIERNHECPESNEQAITLLPDGTIAECPCTFLHHLKEYKEELLKNKNYWEYKSCLIRDNSFYNPLLNNNEKDQDHDWYVYGGGFIGTQSTYANLNLNLAYEMALSHQIDYEYALNPNLLIEHYMANSTTAECYRENVNVTHNHFLTDQNIFRRWYNGFTEYAYKDHKNKINFVLKERLKGENICD